MWGREDGGRRGDELSNNIPVTTGSAYKFRTQSARRGGRREERDWRREEEKGKGREKYRS